MSTHILGISAYYHDSAAALLRDGEIIAAAQEERFSRLKHDQRFPSQAIAFCLLQAGISSAGLAAVAFYDKPFIKFNRILETYLSCAPLGLRSFIKAIPLWLREKLWIPDLIEKELNYHGKILFSEHHESHAASAFFASPFQRAAFLTMDGVGEWATSSFGTGIENRLQIFAEMRFPHSLGLLYSVFTYFCGFKVNSGEYKLMGLAPYGEPTYVQKIYEHLIDLKEDGSFGMNMDYFDYLSGLTMTNSRFERLFNGAPRKPESKITRREMDLARSIQDVTEEIMLRMARHVKKTTAENNLCLAGGVALNCVGNGRLLRSGLFENIWIQPAAGDAGGALGAAYIAFYHHLNNPRSTVDARDQQKFSLLGSEYDNKKIRRFLDERGVPYHMLSNDELLEAVSDLIIDQRVIGWFQGRMEFGPRALGNRSIIGDARSPEMQSKMNLKIKFRESFRPFAPAVLAEEAAAWFEIDRESPYMLLTADVKKEKQCHFENGQSKVNEDTEKIEEIKFGGLNKLRKVRSLIPAVTHVDYSARLQTVNWQDNPLFHSLIKKFFEKTQCPVIINTSFNVRGEPIVESPADAYACFMRTEMDALALGNFLLLKSEQPVFLDFLDWRKTYELD